ncbi:hypothetical protein JCM6882_000954 [Rhodosporidiobolus microsporus]
MSTSAAPTSSSSLALAQTSRSEAMMEFASLGQEDHCPLGVYVWPTEVFEWSATLFLHRGYYAGSILHFRLVIPPNYPQSPPAVVFESPIFHPLVDPVSGRMRLDARFPTWRPRRDFIFHVLHAVKAAFKRKGLDELREAVCANQEAWRLYRTNPPLFTKLASQSALLSSTPSALYSPAPTRSDDAQPSPIRFRRLKGEEGEEEKLREMVREEGERKVVRGKKGSAASLD